MDEPDVTSSQAVAKVDGLRGTEELATERHGGTEKTSRILRVSQPGAGFTGLQEIDEIRQGS